MAMISRRLVVPVLACAAFARRADPAVAQTQPDPAAHLTLAWSSAVLQARMAEIASSRETRQEVKTFAKEMLEFRKGQVVRLEETMRSAGVAIPAALILEHTSLLENLAPLDFLALSRRYAESQVQALEQEIAIYERAGGAGPGQGPLVLLTGETVPKLKELLASAREAHHAVGP